MRSPKAKVYLENSSKVTVLLDMGAKINVMTKKLIEDTNLVMKQGPKLELVLYTGHSCPFLDLYKDMEVVIGRLKTKYPIFVVETGDHDLILSQPFLNSVKFSQEYKLDEIFGTITHLYTQQTNIFHTLAFQNLVNRRGSQIFPHFF